MPSWEHLPTLKQLRALDAVGAACSYQGAADRLAREHGQSFSAAQVWQQVARLQELVDTAGPASHPLVLPRGRGLTPTGEALRERGNRFLAAAAGLDATVRGLHTTRELVRVGCFPAHAGLVATARVTLGQSPSVTVLMEADDAWRDDGGATLVRLVQTGSLDVAIVDASIALATDLTYHQLYSWHIRVIHSPSTRLSIKKGRVSVESLADQPLLVSPPGHHTRLMIDSMLDTSGAFSSASVDALFDMALAGHGVALMASDAFPVRVTEAQRPWPRLSGPAGVLHSSYGTIARAPVSTSCTEVVGAIHAAHQQPPVVPVAGGAKPPALTSKRRT